MNPFRSKKYNNNKITKAGLKSAFGNKDQDWAFSEADRARVQIWVNAGTGDEDYNQYRPIDKPVCNGQDNKASNTSGSTMPPPADEPSPVQEHVLKEKEVALTSFSSSSKERSFSEPDVDYPEEPTEEVALTSFSSSEERSFSEPDVDYPRSPLTSIFPKERTTRKGFWHDTGSLV